jgi:hypothetical protein
VDARRKRVLAEPGGIKTWVMKGRASQFEHDPQAPNSQVPSLVDLARGALRLAGPRVERYWLNRLRALDRTVVETLVARVSGLSDVTATFILEVLEANRGRLIDGS